MIHTDLLRFRRHRYLWWSLVVVVAASAVYTSQRDIRLRSGDTWQGLALGTAGVLLIVWLSMLAVRKRRYSSTAGTMQGWTSAHVYLGSALLVVATLHCAFQFGWNVHTLAYALMCLVIASGLFGLYRYLHVPELVAENRQGRSRALLFGELFDLDKQTRAAAEGCAPHIQTAVDSSISRTSIGGGAWSQLLSQDNSLFLRAAEADATPILARNPDQQPVIDLVADRIPRAQRSEETARLQTLLLLLARRQVVVRRLRRDIRLQGRLELWLYFHTRVTAALLVALTIHVASTFIYR